MLGFKVSPVNHGGPMDHAHGLRFPWIYLWCCNGRLTNILHGYFICIGTAPVTAKQPWEMSEINKCFNIKTVFAGIVIPIIKMILSWGRPNCIFLYWQDDISILQVGIVAVNIGIFCKTSNGSWRQGIKGEMTCTVYVALVWNIIYWIMMIITLFTE